MSLTFDQTVKRGPQWPSGFFSNLKKHCMVFIFNCGLNPAHDNMWYMLMTCYIMTFAIKGM